MSNTGAYCWHCGNYSPSQLIVNNECYWCDMELSAVDDVIKNINNNDQDFKDALDEGDFDGIEL